MIGAVLGRGRRRRTGRCLGGATGLVAASVLSVMVTTAGVAWAAPRDLDSSFGSAGIVQYPTGTGAAATGVAVVPSPLPAAGDIVVSTDGGSSGLFEVARFTPAGAIDKAFGGSGNGLLDPFAGQANAVAVVPAGVTGAGNIVAVGEDTSSATSCGGEQPVVEVVTPAGTTTRTDIPCAAGFFAGVLNAVTIDTSGNIAVAGQVFSPTATLKTLVAELTPTGGVSFSTAGQIGTANSAAMGVGVSPSGADIYTAGYSYTPGNPPVRYLTVAAFSSSTGALDTGFHGVGMVTASGTPNSTGYGVTVLPVTGNVVAAGAFSATVNGPNQSLLAQYTPAGVPPSPPFGAGGQVKPSPTNPPFSSSEYHAVAYQPDDGMLVAAGSALSGSSQEMLAAQYNPVTGAPNTLFGSGTGVVPVSLPPGPSSFAAVAFQPDGKAVGAGAGPIVNASPEIGLVRFQVPPRPYTPITPTRVCDTRQGNGLTGFAAQCNGHTIAAHTSVTAQIAGLFTVPAAASAVVVNVTTVNPAGPGFLTVYPARTAVPTASNLNVVSTNQVVSNLAEVSLSGGALSVFASIHTDVAVDVEGYTAPTAGGGAGAGLYDPLTSPTRVCDTRPGNPSGLTGVAAQCNARTLPVNGRQVVQIAGNFGVPSTATAVVANLTTVNPTRGGFLTVYPDGAPLPTVSNLNFSAGQVIPDRVIVKLGGGKLDLTSSVPTDAILDISGYYTATGGSGTGYVAEPAPVRICDTRTGNPSGLGGTAAQCNSKSLTAGAPMTLKVIDPAFAVPASATAAVLNVTAINPTVGTFLTVYPGPTRPASSDLNPARGGIEPNLVVATLSPSGTITIFNGAGTVDVIVDLAGYYAPPGVGS